jgi:hypothetical protein
MDWFMGNRKEPQSFFEKPLALLSVTSSHRGVAGCVVDPVIPYLTTF